MTARIGLIHPIVGSIEPVERAFAEAWPEAEVISLCDASLYADYSKWGEITPELERRLQALIDYSVSTGANGILFVGSLFGGPVERIRATMDIPVLTAFEAMIEAAFAIGTRFGALATVADALTMMQQDIDRYAAAHGISYTYEPLHVEGAGAALQVGDRSTHDDLIAEAADSLMDCEVLLLAQHSMEPARKLIAQVAGRTLLTSPDTAARKLKQLVSEA